TCSRSRNRCTAAISVLGSKEFWRDSATRRVASSTTTWRCWQRSTPQRRRRFVRAPGVDRATALVSGRSAARLLLLPELRPNVVHVDVTHGGDDLLECGGWQRTGLSEQQDAVAERHQRGDRADAQPACQLTLGLGVDLGEGDVRVCL